MKAMETSDGGAETTDTVKMDTLMPMSSARSNPQASVSIHDVVDADDLADAIQKADQADEETKMPPSDNEAGGFIERQLSNDEFAGPTKSDREITVTGDQPVTQHRVAKPFDKSVISTMTIQVHDGRYLRVTMGDDKQRVMSLSETEAIPQWGGFFRNIPTPNNKSCIQAMSCKDTYLVANKRMPLTADKGAQTQVGRGTWKPAEFDLVPVMRISKGDGSKKRKKDTFYLKDHRRFFVWLNKDDQLAPLTRKQKNLPESAEFKIVRRDRSGVFNPNRQRSVTMQGYNLKYLRVPHFKHTEVNGKQMTWRKWLKKYKRFGFAVCDVPLAARGEQWTSHPVLGKHNWVRLGPPRKGMADAYMFCDPEEAEPENAITFVSKRRLQTEFKKKERVAAGETDLKVNERIINCTQFKVLWVGEGSCALRTFDGRYLAIRQIPKWKNSLMKQTGIEDEDAFQLKHEGAEADLRLVAIPWKETVEELHDREESAIWKVQEVPSVRWFYNVNLNQLSAIDVRQNSFKVDAEITIFRQMLSSELRLWLADQERFNDRDLKLHIGFTPKCKEIILLNKEIYADGKPFQVLWLGFGQCFWIITRYRLCAEYTEALELSSFPFDVQHMQFCLQFDTLSSLYLTVYNDIGGEVEFDKARDRYHIVGGKKQPIKKLEWRSDRFYRNNVGFTMPVTAVSHISDFDLVGIQRTVLPDDPTHAFTVVLQRSWAFYFRKVVLVLMIVSFMSMFVLCVRDADSLLVDDPLAYLSTMLLTIVAFMIILKEDLPALKEASILDQYLLAILIYEFALGFVIVFVDPLDYADDSAHGWLRNPVLWIFLGIWIMIHVAYVVYGVWLRKREMQKRVHSKAEVDKAEMRQSRVKKTDLEIKGLYHNPDYKYMTNTTYFDDELDELFNYRVTNGIKL